MFYNNKFLSKAAFVAAIVLSTAACKAKLDPPTPSTGSADFSKYVALGNSLTAGYADGALYREGQIASYPNMIAEQLKAVGGGEFKLPLMDDGAGNNGAGGPRLVLVKAGTSVAPAPDSRGATKFNYIGSSGPYGNMGVPGAKSFHLLANAYGDATAGNPFYARMSAKPGETNIVDEAAAQQPTFFSLWIGNNDVLGYATSGGEGGGNTVTPSALFNGAIDGIVAKMKASGKTPKGVIVTLPDLLKIPYFTTVPYNAFSLDETKAALVNGGIKQKVSQIALPKVEAQVKAGVKAKLMAQGMDDATAEATATAFMASADGKAMVESELNKLLATIPQVKAGANPFFIADDKAMPFGFRQATADDKILLTVMSYSATPAFQTNPILPGTFVLDKTEQEKVSQAREAYNQKIKDVALANDLALCDIASFFENFVKGMTVDGVSYSASFISGGGFSLDGVHLTQRGYALAANEIIRAINSKYGSSISTVNVNNYKGIEFPN
jgi:lysophospholipase L1-like esterase